MMDWKPYMHDRLIAEHPSGFYVIKSNVSASEEAQPVFCPICERIMKTHYDEESFKKFKCCDHCANDFVYPDRPKWESGWRPTKDDAQRKSRKSS